MARFSRAGIKSQRDEQVRLQRRLQQSRNSRSTGWFNNGRDLKHARSRQVKMRVAEAREPLGMEV